MKNKIGVISAVIVTFLVISLVGVNGEMVNVSNQRNTIFEPDRECAVHLNINNLYNETLNASLMVSSRLNVSTKKSFALPPLKKTTINIIFNSPGTAGIYRINWTLIISSNNGTERKTGSFKITISRILKEIKTMETEYRNEIRNLRNKSYSMNNTEINGFLDHIEKSVSELSRLYEEGKYDEINNKMRVIEAEFIIVREKIEETKAKQQEEFNVTLNTIIWFVVPSILFTSLSFFMLKFYFGNRTTPEFEDLKIINDRISIPLGDVVPIKKRIKRAEDAVREARDKRLKMELDIIKEKYRQGLLGLCEDYLLILEKELEHGKK